MRECEHGRVCNAYGDGLGCPAECGYYEPRIDRDALLALADEMESNTWYESSFDHRLMTRFAHRIREILKGES